MYRTAVQEALYAGDIRYEDIAWLKIKFPRLACVAAFRAGSSTMRHWTLEEIGKALNVTTERVRQLEAKAIGYIKWKRGTPNGTANPL